MGDAFDKLLPIITLLFGAAWGNFLKRGELRTAMRLEAADQLADLPARLWATQGDNDWVELNKALDRLAIRLDMSAVPENLVMEVKSAAVSFWRSVEPRDVNNEIIWVAGSDAALRWDAASALAGDYLGTSNPGRRWMIRRDVRRRYAKSANDRRTG